MNEVRIIKNVYAKKSLGQNFLHDENVLKNIANLFSVTSDDLILEIGPGMGALTKYLVQKNCPVVAYEIDERMRPYLNQFENLQVIYGDFLKTDFQELSTYSYQSLYVVANIPYYITTPILEHFLMNHVLPYRMALLVQKEVADRFCALPNDHAYGFFTVYLNHYFRIRKVFDVPAQCFTPPPKVTSSVVVFEKKETIVSLNEPAFFSFVKECFRQKRKTLKNNLKNYDWDSLFLILQKEGFTEQVRAENLSYEQFVRLFLSL